MEKDDLVRIGVVTSPHGVHGEVKVYPTTDNPERFETVGTVIVTTARDAVERRIENVKWFKGMAILKLSGVSDMDEAEKLRKADLLIHRSQSPCKEGEYFVQDLVGLSVFRKDGSFLGKLTAVLDTGANKVYEVTREDGKEVLLPVIPSCILSVDIEGGTVRADVFQGLED